jgi:hypothetical protein
MNTPNGLTALKDLFTFPFRDPHWQKKLLIGSGLMMAGTIVPLIPLLPVFGYCARMARQAVAGQVAQPLLPAGDEDQLDAKEPAASLPEWDRWEDLFMDGLRQFGVMTLISLPLILLMVIGFGTYFGTYFSAVIGQTSHTMSNSTFLVLIFVSLAVMFLTMGLSFILTPITYLCLPSAAVHVAVTRRFGALFEIGRWFRILRSNMSGYLAMLFFLAGLYMLYVILFQVIYFTVVCCFLLPVASCLFGFYVTILFYNVSGLAYAGGRVD